MKHGCVMYVQVFGKHPYYCSLPATLHFDQCEATIFDRHLSFAGIVITSAALKNEKIWTVPRLETLAYTVTVPTTKPGILSPILFAT